MSQHPAWSPEDIAKLHRLYPDGGPKAVAEATGRPYGSVKVVAHRHGLKADYVSQRRRHSLRLDDDAINTIFVGCGFDAEAAALWIGCHPFTVIAACDRVRNADRASRDHMLATHLAGFLT